MLQFRNHTFNLNFLAERNAIVEDSRSTLLGNRLVMIAPKDSKIDKIDFTDNK